MSGNNQTVICRSCSHSFIPRGKAMTLAMTCPSCFTYFRRGQWNTETILFDTSKAQVIPLGAKGKIDGTVYEVMGFVIKKELRYKYQWREYMLFNPYLGYAFLSEYDGHWNFVWPIEDNPKRNVGNDFTYQDNYYQLYQKYNAEVVYAKGEFFFDIVDMTASTFTEEYISPPLMIGREVSDDSLLSFQGEYITRNELSEAFNIPLTQFPPKNGVGYTEPLSTSFTEKSLLTTAILMALVAILIQIILTSTNAEKTAFYNTFRSTELNSQKVFITPSFVLDGGSKNLEIITSAPVSNDWFYAELTLINEDDGTEYNFTKEIEYYYGYEGGENWSEGSQRGEALLSSIPGGHYHINIYPEFSSQNQEFSILITRDVTTYTNMFIMLIFIGAFPVYYLIRKRFKESARWNESDYSPYDQS